MTPPLKIAVIGAGIAGLGAAWLLSKRHDVTVIESAARLGGHSNTVDVDIPGAACAVDTGFIVYNTACYPNLVALFDVLGVDTAETDMSFAVSRGAGAYEYSGSGLDGVFGQRRNLLRPRHWRLVADIMRFFREAPRLLAEDADAALTLGRYLAREGYSASFVDDHILPMAAAIWSTPKAQVLEFPAVAFVRFFKNHGLLQLQDRPLWRTVRGGSRRYVAKMQAGLAGRVRTGVTGVTVTRTDEGVVVGDGRGNRETFDHVVIGAHADQALGMLTDADAMERRHLGAFRYLANTAVLHTDATLMPKRRRVWASWNYMEGLGGAGDLAVSYWMNKLQPLGVARDLFVSLNPPERLSGDHVIASFDYEHPVFDTAALDAQRQIWTLQGRRRTWFCGSYFGYGFHEDGLQAGLAVAEQLGGLERPWTVAEPSGRIHVTDARPPQPMILEAAR